MKDCFRNRLLGTTGIDGVTGIAPAGTQWVGNYALLFGSTTIEATVPTGGPYFVGVTGGGFTVTFPSAASLGTREIIVQDEVGFSATSATTVATTGGDTINGGASISLNKNYEALTSSHHPGKLGGGFLKRLRSHQDGS